MEPVTCAGLWLSEPRVAFLSCVPCGQVSGVCCPGGQSRGAPRRAPVTGWSWAGSLVCGGNFPGSQMAVGARISCLTHASILAACWLWQTAPPLPPAEVLVPLSPSISALTGTSLTHEFTTAPRAPAAPLVSLCCVWWHLRAVPTWVLWIQPGLGKGALLAWSI